MVPDLAGWKRERFPIEEETNWISVAPDWVCEVLSPSTALRDRTKKKEIYAQAEVGYLWLVDPYNMTVEVYRLGSGASRPPAASFRSANIFPWRNPSGKMRFPERLQFSFSEANTIRVLAITVIIGAAKSSWRMPLLVFAWNCSIPSTVFSFL